MVRWMDIVVLVVVWGGGLGRRLGQVSVVGI